MTWFTAMPAAFAFSSASHSNFILTAKGHWCVMLGIDPMEPTEKALTAASLRWVLLLRLQPSAILVSALVPATAPILVLVRGCEYVVDLTVFLLRWVILPPLRLVPLPLLLLLLRRIGSVKSSVAAFVGFAIFLHDFKEFLQRLRLDSVEHILAVSNPQAYNDGVDDAAFGHLGHTRCQLDNPVHVLLQ
jgi:hypothetical protein